MKVSTEVETSESPKEPGKFYWRGDTCIELKVWVGIT